MLRNTLEQGLPPDEVAKAIQICDNIKLCLKLNYTWGTATWQETERNRCVSMSSAKRAQRSMAGARGSVVRCMGWCKPCALLQPCLLQGMVQKLIDLRLGICCRFTKRKRSVSKPCQSYQRPTHAAASSNHAKCRSVIWVHVQLVLEMNRVGCV